MKEKSLDEQADELLRGLALREGKSMRQLGIIDARRQRTISGKEFPLSAYRPRNRRHKEEDEDDA